MFTIYQKFQWSAELLYVLTGWVCGQTHRRFLFWTLVHTSVLVCVCYGVASLHLSPVHLWAYLSLCDSAVFQSNLCQLTVRITGTKYQLTSFFTSFLLDPEVSSILCGTGLVSTLDSTLMKYDNNLGPHSSPSPPPCSWSTPALSPA